jgi:hypothetical protein
MTSHLPSHLVRLGLVATLLGCGGGPGAGEASRGREPAELSGIVAAHNAVRAGVGPLVWSDSLAATAAGEVCGHYTQVAWAATTQVGCARHDGPSLTYRSTIVCDHGPGGNSGGRPY